METSAAPQPNCIGPRPTGPPCFVETSAAPQPNCIVPRPTHTSCMETAYNLSPQGRQCFDGNLGGPERPVNPIAPATVRAVKVCRAHTHTHIHTHTHTQTHRFLRTRYLCALTQEKSIITIFTIHQAPHICPNPIDSVVFLNLLPTRFRTTILCLVFSIFPV